MLGIHKDRGLKEMANTNPTYINDFWENFGDSSQLVEIECKGPEGSLAAHVLETFGLYKGAATNSIGGNISNLDIKHMDAMSVINLSLLEEAAESSFGGDIYEAMVNEYGEVDFVAIGENSADLSDIYYQVQTSSYKDECKGVMITGGKPMPIRKELGWKPIWGAGNKKIYDTSKMITNCNEPGYSTHAIIVFNNPHLDTLDNDGINNLYEISDPFESIVGYAKYIHAPGKTAETNIAYSGDSTIIPIQVGTTGNPYVGILQDRPKVDPAATIYGSSCWVNASKLVGDVTDAVKIDIPEEFRFEDIRNTKVDKFVKVNQVLIIGYEIHLLKTAPNDASVGVSEVPSDENTYAMVHINNTVKGIYKLDEGKHYVIVYSPEDDDDGMKDPYILFGKDTKPNEPKSYGNNTNYMLSPFCELAKVEGTDKKIGTIIPCSENRGYLVEEIWTMVNINSPSISVSDPEYDPEAKWSKAIDIATNLEYMVTPIMLYDPPAPIAFNGEEIDQTQGIADKDPTTAQDLDATELELAMDVMDGGSGLTLSLSFITDIEKLKNISESLYLFMNADSGIETTYVCGPSANPHLGDAGPSGGIINSITYSYTDSSSYTISVNEGSRIIGNFASSSGGPSMKATESVSSRGTIIKDMGNNIFYKVKMDGFGDRIAINTSPTILREGDIVSCSIHNNPVEV